MNESNTHEKRRKRQKRLKLFIYPKFQVVLLVVNFITMLLTIGFVEFQVIRFFDYMEKLGKKAGFGEFHSYFKFIEMQKDTIINGLVLALVIGLVLSTIIYLVLSHKVSGPIIRLISFFEGVNETGKFDPLFFRKNDFFKELPPIINEALLTIKEPEKYAEKEISEKSSDQ